MTCMTRDCHEESYVRGVCKQHYDLYRWLIHCGRTTWTLLEAMRRVLPIARP